MQGESSMLLTGIESTVDEVIPLYYSQMIDSQNREKGLTKQRNRYILIATRNLVKPSCSSYRKDFCCCLLREDLLKQCSCCLVGYAAQVQQHVLNTTTPDIASKAFNMILTCYVCNVFRDMWKEVGEEKT